MIADPAVPRRDALLRPETMAGVISQRLLGGVPVERCERVHVKYRVGESLRVVYRHDGAYVAARTGRRDGIAAPEVGAALYPFPHDRKLDLAAVGRVLDEGLSPHLVAWAAEQSATFECRDTSGRVVAYAKVRRDAAPWPALDAVRVPRVLAAAGGVLLLEALAGRRLDTLAGEGLHALGAALSALHATNLNGVRPSLGAGREIAPPAHPQPALQAGSPHNLKGVRPLLGLTFNRFEPTRLCTAAEVIGRVRPDVAPAAQRLLARLVERIEDAEREPVLLHGDVNPRNALLQAGGTVALLDLEDLGIGPAAADLGQVLAALIVNRTPQAARAFLRGYGDPPDQAALRWYMAASLLARQALPAVARHRPPLLARLPALLDAGSALLGAKAAAA